MPAHPIGRLLAAALLAVALRSPALCAQPTMVRVPAWSLSAEPVTEIGGAAAEGAQQLFQAHGATRLSDGRVVVADGGSREIRIFGRDGRHLRTMGGKGGGPGEFQFLTWVGRFGPDSILAYDESMRRLVAYGPTGDQAGTVELSLPGTPSFPQVLGVFDDGRVLARPGFDRQFGRGERRDTVPYLLYARTGQRADTVLRLAGEERYFVATPDFSARLEIGFGRDAHAAVAGRHAVFGASDALTVTLLGAEGRRQTLQSAWRPEPVPAAAVRRWRETLLETQPRQFAERLRRFVPEVPARATYPAYAQLAVDPSGRYWVREYPREPDAGGSWIVYAPTGTPVARLRTPPRFTVLEVGTDYVLGRALDEHDVESIRVYAIRR